MTHRHRLLAQTLLFDLSLTSSRHLGRLFSQSEAPFWTARNQSRFRLLHSDYPLYFASVESLRLDARKHTDEDRYCVCILDVYEAAIPSAGPHSQKIADRLKLDQVSIRGTVGSSFGRNRQPRGPRADTQFLGWLKQFFGVRLVLFDISAARTVGDCPLLKLVRFSYGTLLSCAPTVIRVGDPNAYDYPQSYESMACALGVSTRKTKPETAESLSKGVHHALQPRTFTI